MTPSLKSRDWIIAAVGIEEERGRSLSLLLHVGFGLWAAGWMANFPPSARAETEPLPVSVEDVFDDSTAAAGGGGTGWQGSGESARPLHQAAAGAARGAALASGRAMKGSRPGEPKASIDPLDDPFSKWLFGLPVISSHDGARTGDRGGGASSAEADVRRGGEARARAAARELVRLPPPGAVARVARSCLRNGTASSRGGGRLALSCG